MVTVTTRCISPRLPTCLTNTKIHLTRNKAFYPTVEKAAHKINLPGWEKHSNINSPSHRVP